ncbi:MAG TPA: hypothetical protein VME70_11890 [Mycobacteriales bacterium]|nr:hypothetical protein [Mycobacteriales bacterium]
MGDVLVTVIRGQEAAREGWRLLEAGASTVIDEPRVAGGGWWLVEAEDATTPVTGAELALGVSALGADALVIEAGAADAGLIWTVDAESRAVSEAWFGLMELAVEESVTVAARDRVNAWLAANAPKRLREPSRLKLWTGLCDMSGREAIPYLLSRWGWRYVPGRDSAALFSNCLGTENQVPPWVGESPLREPSLRWVLGRTLDMQLGMWDADHPGPPVQIWPNDREGRAAWRHAQYQREVLPILESTTLPGERRWTAIRGESATSAFFHYDDRARRASVVVALPDRPRTLQAMINGRMRLMPSQAERVGLTEPTTDPTPVEVAISSVGEAERVAWALLSNWMPATWGVDPSPFMDVPDDVPRGFLPTWRWMLSREQG